MASQTLSERLQELVQEKTDEYRRFKALETATSIPADTWKSWFHGRQRPTAEMIEAICKCWPEHALWLTTGTTDAIRGHHSPKMDDEFRPRTAARDLLIAQIQLSEWEASHSFTQADLEHEIEKNDGLSDSAKTWMRMFEKINQLSEIRDEQEISLRRHESRDHLKKFE